MTDAQLISLLRDALALWSVPGRIGPGDHGVELTFGASETLTVWRGDPPLRWWLATEKRARPVAGVTALLAAIRSAVGARKGPSARIGTGAAEAAAVEFSPSDPAGASLSPARDTRSERTIVSVITGFLGSGKTTLVSRLLRHPAMGRTAVIVNEFGEVGLDHDLIERGDDTVMQLTTGCLCCAMQANIARTLLDLARRRDSGEIGFDRVLVETSGLADPAPILHALMTDDAVGALYAIGSVVTLVDAELGVDTLRRHPEAQRQVSLADLIMISKTDITPGSAALAGTLRALNTEAPIVTGIADPEALFHPLARRETTYAAALHTPELGALIIERPKPMPALALTLFVQALTAHVGEKLLRLKGFVELAEMPGRPVIVHGVQYVFSPPAPLPGWPGADRHTRIVVIGQDIPAHFPTRLLDAIVAEVEDETARSTACAGAYMSVVSNPSVAAPISAASDIGRP